MASSSSRLPPSQPWSADLQFELYRRDARDALRAFLVTVSDRCVAGWHVAHHLGFLPHTSIKNKFPYHKCDGGGGAWEPWAGFTGAGRAVPLAGAGPLRLPSELPITGWPAPSTHRRAALAHPELAAKISTKQAHALQLHAACRTAPPAASTIRPRPHRARDAFGPGMVFVVNTVLAWLMFSIDVRNAMLK